jgi:pimeloyl-ACP methyl ester carboxylesterase
VRATLLLADPERRSDTRIVLLPGAFQSSTDLTEAGFPQSVRSAGLAIDLLLVDLELEHLTDRTLLSDLHARLAEARAEGCSRLWLAGISLGGFLALLYAESHPGTCDGLLLLAPYLGNRVILSDPEHYLSADNCPEREPAELAEERRVWKFIRQPPAGSPALWLGFGRADRFATAHRLMARALPPAQVDEVPGGHGWPVWLQLWQNFLPKLQATALATP